MYNRNVIAYLEHAGGVNQDSNFGWKLLHESPFFLQLFLKPIIFFIFPIPFWSKIGSLDSYDLYKTIFNLNCYFYLPLLSGIFSFIKNKSLRNHFNYFNLTLFFLFLYGICFTSFEQRHLGPFLINLFYYFNTKLFLAKIKNSAIVGIYFSPFLFFTLSLLRIKI